MRPDADAPSGRQTAAQKKVKRSRRALARRKKLAERRAKEQQEKRQEEKRQEAKEEKRQEAKVCAVCKAAIDPQYKDVKLACNACLEKLDDIRETLSHLEVCTIKNQDQGWLHEDWTRVLALRMSGGDALRAADFLLSCIVTQHVLS
jgi:flagellar biosynthesis GTPase FlhF